MPVAELRRLVETVSSNLRHGKYQNESSVREAIVLPILHSLGWNTLDPSIVRREHPIGSRKVDYCLSVRQTTPDLLIEVKAVGQIDGGDKQLFEYAFHEGVPMVLLTDGREWSFYLPAGRGSYDDRRVYKLDVLERDADESCRVLSRYLAYERVRQQEAISDARNDYEKAARQRTAADTLDAAWQKLVGEPSSLLIDLLAETTQTLCGYEPTRDQIVAFLGSLNSGSPAPISDRARPHRPRHKIESPTSVNPPISIGPGQDSGPRTEAARRIEPAASSDGSSSNGRGVQVRLDGEIHAVKNAITGLMQILRHLSARDPTFLDRLAVRTLGRARHHLARSREDVYPHRPDLVDSATELLPGWFIDTNISNREKLKIVRHACDVAGLQQGRDVDLIAS